MPASNKGLQDSLRRVHYSMAANRFAVRRRDPFESETRPSWSTGDLSQPSGFPMEFATCSEIQSKEVKEGSKPVKRTGYLRTFLDKCTDAARAGVRYASVLDLLNVDFVHSERERFCHLSPVHQAQHFLLRVTALGGMRNEPQVTVGGVAIGKVEVASNEHLSRISQRSASAEGRVPALGSEDAVCRFSKLSKIASSRHAMRTARPIRSASALQWTPNGRRRAGGSLGERDALTDRRHGRMWVSPPVYGWSASGTRTEPSGSWYCSRIATSVRPTARPEPLRVFTNLGFSLAPGR